MPEQDFGDKTEQPTPRRRQEARQRGQVAKSADLNAAILLLAALIIFWVVGPSMLGKLKMFMQVSFEQAGNTFLTLKELPQFFARVMMVVLDVMGPLVAGLLVMGVLSNVLQSGFLVSGHPLKPRFDKLNPLVGLKRIFSRKSAMRLVISMAKVVVMGVILFITIRGEIDSFQVLPQCHFTDIVNFASVAIFKLALRMALALLILGILDYAWQYMQHERDMKMTKQEVRDELKRMEGDPLLRERRRGVQRQLALQRTMAEVPKATAVVTNPTHFSIALRYEPGMNAPVCVGKGTGKAALQIRKVATEHDIPIVERPALARSLYPIVETGKEIPIEFYKTVAEVLAYVYELNRQMGKQVPREATA